MPGLSCCRDRHERERLIERRGGGGTANKPLEQKTKTLLARPTPHHRIYGIPVNAGPRDQDHQGKQDLARVARVGGRVVLEEVKGVSERL